MMTICFLALMFLFLPNTFMVLQSIVINHLLMNLCKALNLPTLLDLLIHIDQVFTEGFLFIASTPKVWILKPLDMRLGNKIYDTFANWFYQTQK